MDDKTKRMDIPEGSDKTKRMDRQLHVDKTLRLNTPGSDSFEDTVDKTLKYQGSKEVIEGFSLDQTDTFLLNGKSYKLLKVISESTGEAQIYLIENEGKNYVLKLYYPNFSPKKGLLQIIKNFNFEMIVKVFDYGILRQGTSERVFELMEYLEGGTLEDIDLNNDEERLKKIALASASALAFCHNNNIIHKDIKPGNFFFRDKFKKQVVLGDFGISSLCDDEESLHKTTQARTPVYAAPEMYINVIDGEVELTNKIDYYSLGITLLTVWLGKNPFSGNERAMMRMKAEGNIPNLEQLPPAVNILIRGLTIVNPNNRWGFDEVQRWYKGEEVPILDESPMIRYKKFIFDPEKNLSATNVKELAALLYSDKKQAIKYLYNKRVSKWLDEGGNQKLAVDIDEITEKRYPLNQEAGLMAAIYMLDIDFPYHDLQGKVCTTLYELAETLKNNKENYKTVLQNSEDNFYLYLEASGEIVTANRFRSYFKNLETEVAFWKVVYEMDSQQPFLQVVEAEKEKKKTIACSSIADILNTYRDYAIYYVDIEPLIDGRLLSWLSNKEEPVLYDTIEQLTAGEQFSIGLAYGILYHLDIERGFDLKLKEDCKDEADESFTRQDVGYLMSGYLINAQNLKEKNFKEEMDDFLDSKGKLYYYCKAHEWADILTFKDYCLTLNSKEIKQKFGEYNIRIAAYKLCAGLGYTPNYYFEKSDKSIDLLEELSAISEKEIIKELKNGSLKEWLTIFFHEDPFASFDKTYEYEKTLERYLEFIGKYDRDDFHFSRFNYAREQAIQLAGKVRRVFKSAQIMEAILAGLFGLTTLTLIAFFLLFDITNVDAYIDNIYWVIGLPLMLVGGGIALVWALASDLGCLLSLLIMGGGGFLAALPAAGIKWVLKQNKGQVDLISIGFIVLLTLIFLWIAYRRSTLRIGYLKMLFTNLNENNLLIEPLYFAYKTSATSFSGSSFGALNDSIGVVRQTRSGLLKVYSFSIILMGAFLCLFFYFHPALGGKYTPKPDVDNELLGEWHGTFQGNASTFIIQKISSDTVVGNIIVKFRKTVDEQLSGTIDRDNKVIHLEDVKKNGRMDGKFDFNYKSGEKKMTGTYHGDLGKVIEYTYLR